MRHSLSLSESIHAAATPMITTADAEAIGTV
jgi:hypothetical protein